MSQISSFKCFMSEGQEAQSDSASIPPSITPAVLSLPHTVLSSLAFQLSVMFLPQTTTTTVVATNFSRLPERQIFFFLGAHYFASKYACWWFCDNTHDVQSIQKLICFTQCLKQETLYLVTTTMFKECFLE